MYTETETGDRDKFDYSRDPKHNYLLTESLQSRYTLATHYLCDCSHIVEIGSFQTPITEFLKTPHKSITVIDPMVDPYHAEQHNGLSCKVQHIPVTLQDYEDHHDQGSYGLVLLGLDLDFPQNAQELANQTFQKLIGLIDNAHVTVIEYATHYKVAAGQVDYILSRTKTEVVQQTDLDFRENETAVQFNPNMSKSYLQRRLVVLKPKRS